MAAPPNSRGSTRGAMVGTSPPRSAAVYMALKQYYFVIDRPRIHKNFHGKLAVRASKSDILCQLFMPLPYHTCRSDEFRMTSSFKLLKIKRSQTSSKQNSLTALS